MAIIYGAGADGYKSLRSQYIDQWEPTAHATPQPFDGKPSRTVAAQPRSLSRSMPKTNKVRPAKERDYATSLSRKCSPSCRVASRCGKDEVRLATLLRLRPTQK